MIINYSDQEVKKGKKSIFLAGPTPRKKEVNSWRPEAVEILEKLNYDGIVYVPELSTGEKLFDYTSQVEWETEALQNATVIVFWVPRKIPDMMALTTNCEFGEWYKSGKVLYGRPEGAKSIKYLDHKYFDYTKSLPFDNLYDLLKQAVESSKSYYEIDIIKNILTKFPESSFLAQKAEYLTVDYSGELLNKSFGNYFFPHAKEEKLQEFNRTMLSVVLYYYLKDNKYDLFVECQSCSQKLTYQDFTTLRKFIFSVVNTVQKENLLLYYLVISGIGKTKYAQNELREIGIESNDCNIVLKNMIEYNMLLTFDDLKDSEKEVLIIILNHGVNIEQIIQGECTSYTLSSLQHLSKFEIELMLVESILDIAGALGHIVQNGSKSLDHYTFTNFYMLVKTVIANDNNYTTTFEEYIDSKSIYYGIRLIENIDLRRAATRIALMLKLETSNDIWCIIKVLIEHPTLTKELNITGYENQEAILLYYSSDLFKNTFNYYKDKGIKEALFNCLEVCIPFLEKVYAMARKKTSGNNGVVSVMLHDVALIAANNPEKLEEFDINSLTLI